MCFFFLLFRVFFSRPNAQQSQVEPGYVPCRDTCSHGHVRDLDATPRRVTPCELGEVPLKHADGLALSYVGGVLVTSSDALSSLVTIVVRPGATFVASCY